MGLFGVKIREKNLVEIKKAIEAAQREMDALKLERERLIAQRKNSPEFHESDEVIYGRKYESKPLIYTADDEYEKKKWDKLLNTLITKLERTINEIKKLC